MLKGGTNRPAMTTVFVVGAGFSRDLGYPLTRDLLKRLPMSVSLWGVLRKVVKFHHPDWDGRKDSLPDIETLLTEWTANEELLPALRPGGPFRAEDLRHLRQDLLGAIAYSFHRIHRKRSAIREWIHRRFFKMVSTAENPVIISFNWDYELDKILCKGRKHLEVYGVVHPSKTGHLS